MDEAELRNSLIALHRASFAWAMVCCRDRDLAEEVLQSVYLKILQIHAAYDGRSSFRTWLFTVIRNAARDQQRRRWWSGVLRLEFDSHAEPSDSTQDELAKLTDTEQCEMLRAAVGRLPQRQRQVAHLVFYQDLTVADAAGVMGVSVGAARRHYARAKDALRNALHTLRNETNAPVA